MNIQCRCLGNDLITPCEGDATEEDGLCDHCRGNGCEARFEEVVTLIENAGHPEIAQRMRERAGR